MASPEQYTELLSTIWALDDPLNSRDVYDASELLKKPEITVYGGSSNLKAIMAGLFYRC